MKEPPYRVKNMMPGMIMLWYGAVDNVPSGWHLCDGTMGTPDLVGRFVRGAGEAYPVDERSGSNGHDHEFTGDGHSHDLTAGTAIKDSSPDGQFSHNVSIATATGEVSYKSHIPKYHQLCYIMKL